MQVTGFHIVPSGIALCLLVAAAAHAATPGAGTTTLPVDAQRQLIDKYCMDCHNYSDYAGGVEFEVFDPADAHESAKLTERMLKKLRAGMMPPAGKPSARNAPR